MVGIWLLMTVGGIAFILRFGSLIPFVDDWAVILKLSSGERPTLDWLWSQHNEHRYPLCRLVMWASWQWSGGDLRASMVCAFVPLAAVALILLLAVRGARRRMEYTDAFFPLVLLHLGNSENFLWFIQSFFIWTAFLFGLLLCFVLRPAWWQRPAAVVGAGLCLILLPLQGAMGLACVPALTILFVLLALRCWLEPQRRGRLRAVILLTCAAFAVFLIGAYFWDFRVITRPPVDRSPLRIAATAARFLSVGMGPITSRIGLVGSVLIGGLLSSGVVLLGYALLRGPRPERFRALLFLVALGGPLSLALGLAWGRTEGAAGRYVIIAAPVWCWAYLVWAFYGPEPVGRFVRMSLFSLMCALSLYYVSLGMDIAKDRQKRTDEFQKEVAEGVPASGLSQWACYWCWDEAPFRQGLDQLREEGRGLFARIAAEPPMQDLRLPAGSAQPTRLTRDGETWRGTGSDSSLRFTLKKPLFVYEVRLKYTLTGENAPARMTVSWLRDGAEDPRRTVEGREFPIKLFTGPREKTQTIWVNDTIRDIFISPSEEPFQFNLLEIVLRVKAEDMPSRD